MNTIISSTQNASVKRILKYKKENKRKKERVIIVEGEKEVEMALASDFLVQEAFISPELCKTEIKNIFLDKNNFFLLSVELFKKISGRENPDGLIVVGKKTKHKLEDIIIKRDLFVLALENIEKPGNLGAIIRSADAAGVDAVILIDSLIDEYNPNAIRNSRGAVFVLPIVSSDLKSFLKWLQVNNLHAYAADPENAPNYSEFNYENKTVFILGNEHNGLSKKMKQSIEKKIKIPMLGKIDSLNISVSAAILMYELVRQRKKANIK